MRECVRHNQICKFYRRSTETPICYQCKIDIEKKYGQQNDRQSNMMNMNQFPDDRSQKSQKSNANRGLGQPQQYNLTLEKEKILKIEEYTEAFLDTVKKKYDEMEACYKEYQTEVEQKDKFFKIESQLMMTRIQKFISYMLVDAQKEMHKNLDFH